MAFFPSHADGPRSNMNSVLNLRVVLPWSIIGYVQWFTGGDLARAEAFDLFPPENLDLMIPRVRTSYNPNILTIHGDTFVTSLSMTISVPMIVIGALNLVEPPKRQSQIHIEDSYQDTMRDKLKTYDLSAPVSIPKF
ncbi:hypothetical protein OG21DRAFT_910421 [Imleria badia]|nr:hypothetical protein OG21DRAFT_910421 [Imleria badia]